VYRPADEVYRYCHELENFARIFDHVESVELTGGGRSHWKMRFPAGKRIEWDVEIVEDVPNERIAWRAVDASLEGDGMVRLASAPGGRGTEVTVELQYDAPAGAVGEALLRLLEGDPSDHVRTDLRRFKQVMETGEVIRSDACPDGPRPLPWVAKQRPAQPLA
jgi:uncharacterized membrane protein